VRTIAIMTLFCFGRVSDATAQSSFEHLLLKPGDFVYATDADGIEVAGPITSLSPSSLSIAGRSFTPAPGLKIERRGDSIWDGAAIGAAIGLGVGTLMSSGECGVNWHAWQCSLAGGVWGGIIGTLIDFAHKGRTTVFLGTATTAEGVYPARAPGRLPTSISVRFSF
jgi:hypothetical protein